MSYVEENLQPGETVTYRAHLHPIVFVVPAVIALVGVIVLFRGALLALLLFVPLVVAYLSYTRCEFAVTSQRVLIKVGVLRRRSLELLLSKIEGVAVVQGIVGRMFDFGTIIVNGTGGTKEPFNAIKDPLEFRRHVQAQISAESVAPSRAAPPAGVREERECPHCAELILAKATTCKHCGQAVASAPA